MANPPVGMAEKLRPLPPSVRLVDALGHADIYLLFATLRSEAESLFHSAMKHLSPSGAIWVAWPKRASKVETDISENDLRDLFLGTGLVDNKVCAIDETWSGLRFVVRRELRASWGAP